jgi:glyoxylase-like metal-dependent hydrolase (beta-lactamase superfamily II)
MTNAYLVGDERQSGAVVIDPAWDGEVIVQEAQRRGWRINNIWLTHAHFDHFGGAAAVADAYDSPVPVSLHPADHPLWRNQGGAAYFGFGSFDPGPEPTIDLEHGMELHFGSTRLEVRHTPGHCPGHVMFSAADLDLVFCGDLIFQSGVGRTDLPGGDWQTLLQSIENEILVLPDETLLLSGHGPATTVGQERRSNPFLGALR